MEAARSKAGKKVCLPVKADAYGHGALSISRIAIEAGAEYLGVATVGEGLELRAGGITAPILLFAQALPEEIPSIVSAGLSPFISDPEFAQMLDSGAEQLNKKGKVHLKIDSGMGRNGCRPEAAADLAGKIVNCRNLILEGTATHLSVSDSENDDDMAYTKEQLCKFNDAISSIRDAGLDPGIVHAANSGGLVFHEDSYFDMIRPGIFCYGYSPSDKLLPAKPVMELRSNVTVIKQVKKGEAISYGRTYITPEDTFIGIIPLGYSDGLSRRLSGDHLVKIGEDRYPIVGRICMDQCMLNLGPGTKVKRGDEVTIFGPGYTDLNDLYLKLNTIPNDLACAISKRVVRVYKD